MQNKPIESEGAGSDSFKLSTEQAEKDQLPVKENALKQDKKIKKSKKSKGKKERKFDNKTKNKNETLGNDDAKFKSETIATVPSSTSSNVSTSSIPWVEYLSLVEESPVGSIDHTPFGVNNADGYLLLSPSLDHKAVQTKADADQEFGINMFNGRVQPTIKLKLPKYVDSRDTVIDVDPIADAKRRAIDYKPNYESKPDYFFPVLPRTINYLMNLNVSGYLPHESIVKYAKYEDDINSLSIEAKEKIQATDRKLSTYTYGDVTHDHISKDDYDQYIQFAWKTKSDITVAPDSIKPYIHNMAAVRQRAVLTDPKLTIKKLDIKFNTDADLYPQNILEDVSTIKFMKSIHKIRYNAQAYYVKNPKIRLSFFLQDISVINSTIAPSIEMATVLYILLDAFKSNLDFRATLGHKLGIVDTGLKFFMNKSTTWKANFEASLLKLYDIFALIPVNVEVINAWNSYKNASISKDGELANEDVLILSPIFRLIGDFFEAEITSFETRATINDPKITVPSGSPLSQLMKTVRQIISVSKFNNKIIKSGFDEVLKFKGKSDMLLSTDKASHDITVSANRMTGFMADFFASVAETSRVNKFLFEFLNTHFSFFNHIKEAGYFSGTIFEYMTPDKIDLKTAKDVQKLSVDDKALFMLNDQFVSMNGNPLFPILDRSKLNSNINDVKVYIPYDINSNKAIYQTLYKGFLVDAFDKLTNRGINSNLSCIVMTQTIIIPFFEEGNFYASINGETPFSGTKLTFTKGLNQDIYYLPTMCEWTSWRDEFRSQINANDIVAHLSNNNKQQFYTAPTVGHFLNSAQFGGDIMGFIKELPLMIPSRSFFPTSLINDKHSIIPYDSFGLDKIVRLAVVQPRWLNVAFSAKSIMDYDAGSDFQVDESRISLKG